MTLGNNTIRVLQVLLGHLLGFGILFYLVSASLPSDSGFLGGAQPIEVALFATMVAMVALVVGVGIGDEARFYRSEFVYLHLGAAAVTLSVLVAAEQLAFGGLRELPELAASAAAYYGSTFGFGLIVVAVASLLAHLFITRTGESLIEPLVVVVLTAAVATVLFALTGVWALTIVLGFLGGLTIHTRVHGERGFSRGDNVTELGETPAFLRQQAE